ncbi:MAG: hypothetical protein P4L71_03810 [Acetobacteraceae bacterium]|nr:hypothetical protein [Acetobacteraceae bacterium]
MIDPTTGNVIEMAYENGLVWQKNTNNLWWSKAAPSDAWHPPAGTAVDPIPNQQASANDSIVTAIPGVATTSISDASGNVWSIANGQVTLNGVADASTANVIELAYANGQVWQENSAHLWWSKTKPSDAWGPPYGTSVSPVQGITRTWNGSSDAFATPGDWSPSGVPQAGDTAVVASGDVAIGAGTASGVNFLLQGGEVDFHTAGSYSIGTLHGSGQVTLGYPGQSVTLTTTGLAVSGGTLAMREFSSSTTSLIVHGNSSVTNGGVLSSQYIGTGSLPRGPLENDGTMTVSGSTLSVGALTGSGIVLATGNSNLSLYSAPTSETIELQSGHLTIGGAPNLPDTVMQFLAPVKQFGASSAITLDAVQATQEVFAKSAPTAGELFLYNGSTLVADLHISGQANIYAADTPAGLVPGSVTLTAYDTGHSLPIVSHV